MKSLEALQEIWEQANNWLQDCDCYPNSPTYAKYERKRKTIEKELKEKKYLDHFLDTIFDIFNEDIILRTQYDKDLRKYEVYFRIECGIEFHFYCGYDEYLYWREISGVDDQYDKEDLR